MRSHAAVAQLPHPQYCLPPPAACVRAGYLPPEEDEQLQLILRAINVNGILPIPPQPNPHPQPSGRLLLCLRSSAATASTAAESCTPAALPVLSTEALCVLLGAVCSMQLAVPGQADAVASASTAAPLNPEETPVGWLPLEQLDLCGQRHMGGKPLQLLGSLMGLAKMSALAWRERRHLRWLCLSQCGLDERALGEWPPASLFSLILKGFRLTGETLCWVGLQRAGWQTAVCLRLHSTAERAHWPPLVPPHHRHRLAAYLVGGEEDFYLRPSTSMRGLYSLDLSHNPRLTLALAPREMCGTRTPPLRTPPHQQQHQHPGAGAAAAASAEAEARREEQRRQMLGGAWHWLLGRLCGSHEGEPALPELRSLSLQYTGAGQLPPFQGAQQHRRGLAVCICMGGGGGLVAWLCFCCVLGASMN